jgi:tetraacyldisaccharide 4'-kinase
LSGKKAIIFSGLGNPASFRKTVETMRVTIVRELTFSDHYAYTQTDIGRINQIALDQQADFILTTEKDAVRLPEGTTTTVLCLKVGLRLEPDRSVEDILSFLS